MADHDGASGGMLVNRKKKAKRGSTKAAAAPVAADGAAGGHESFDEHGHHRRTHSAPSTFEPNHEPTLAATGSLDDTNDAPLLASHDGHAIDRHANVDKSRWDVVQKSVWSGWCSLLDMMPSKVVSNKLFVPAIPGRSRQRLLDRSSRRRRTPRRASIAPRW